MRASDKLEYKNIDDIISICHFIINNHKIKVYKSVKWIMNVHNAAIWLYDATVLFIIIVSFNVIDEYMRVSNASVYLAIGKFISPE